MTREEAMGKYQTLERRFGALIVDGLVLGLPFAGFDYWLLSLALPKPLLLAWVAVGNAAAPLYYVLMQGWYGQTLGKMLLGVKVVRHDDEGAISMNQAALREIAAIALAVMGFAADSIKVVSEGRIDRTAEDPVSTGIVSLMAAWGIAEIICTLTNPKRRAVHDLIAGTVVVRVDKTEAEPV